MSTITLHNKINFLFPLKTDNSSKFKWAEFKSENENFVSPTIFDGKEMKGLCMNKVLL